MAFVLERDTVPDDMRLHLVDGTYELFRAHFSPRPGHHAPDGLATQGDRGAASRRCSRCWPTPDEAVTHLAVAFDNPIRSFRNDLFAGYKSDEGVPPELLAQFDPVEEAMRALGVTVWSMREYEADDALATGARRFAAEVEQVRILTPDKDLGQCLRGAQVVQVDRMQQKVIDEAALPRAARHRPGEHARLAGARSATPPTASPGCPASARRAPRRCSAPTGTSRRSPPTRAPGPSAARRATRWRATLAEHREEALLYRKLATLRTDAPVDASLSALEHRGIPREPFELFARQVDAPGLLSRVTRWAA